MALILLALFYVFTPLGILHLCHRYKFVNKLGAVLIAYAVGLVLGNLGILPAGSEKVQEIITSAAVPLALPLLLYSVNIRRWSIVAGKTMLSMAFGLVGVIVTVALGYLMFRSDLPNIWKIGGMLVGVYSGGTPNLAAIQTALKVPPETFIIVNTYDIVVSTVYLFFLITVGQKVFHKFLPKFHHENAQAAEEAARMEDNPYAGMLKRKLYRPLAKALGASILIVIAAVGLSLLLTGGISMLVVILGITTLGILGSFWPAMNRIEKTFELGMYFILIFCIAVASMADASRFKGMTPHLFQYVALVIFGSLLLHVLLSKLFRVDADTVMVTSAALICSPPFVPVVAAAIKNREVIVSGLTVGIIGYAVGNYLGVTIAYLLKML